MTEFEPPSPNRDAEHLPVLGLGPDALWEAFEREGIDLFRAMRSVWSQNRELSRAAEMMTFEGVSAPLGIPEFIERVPHGFDNVFVSGQNAAEGIVALSGPAGPPPDQVISWWAAVFGPYTKTGNPIPNVVVNVPIYDYAAEKMVENALSITVDYTNETQKDAKVSLSFKGIGVTGTYSSTITTGVKVPATSATFQVVVPCELELTEWVGPMTNDIRYTAKVIHTHAAFHAAKNHPDYAPVVPRTQALLPVNFLTSEGLGVSVSENIKKSQGFEATVSHTFTNGAILGVEYAQKARSEIGVVYTKLRKDPLKRQLWKDAAGLVRIS